SDVPIIVHSITHFSRLGAVWTQWLNFLPIPRLSLLLLLSYGSSLCSLQSKRIYLILLFLQCLPLVLIRRKSCDGLQIVKRFLCILRHRTLLMLLVEVQSFLPSSD